MLNQFCKYNNWANSFLFDALIANSDRLPESCISLFSHIMNAQTIWLSRINGIKPNVGVWEVHNLETCKTMMEKTAIGLAQVNYVELKEAEILKYTTTTGVPFETSVTDILMHVFNHGTYHRAQIAKEMKLHQINPVNTDYIQFVRAQPK